MHILSKLAALFFILILGSCVNTKYVHKGNKVYQIHDDGSGTPKVIVRSVTTSGIATIEDKGNYLIIKPSNKAGDKKIVFTDIDSRTAIKAKEIVGWRADIQEQNYFPENAYTDGDQRASRFVYFDSKPVLQGLTVPIKIRPKLTAPALKDSFPSSVETGVNVGVAFGWKLTENVFSANRNLFGQNTNRYSLTPGTFLGFGGVDLKKANTRDPNIPFERKALSISTGIFLMFGFNNLNFGYTLGVDFATGTGSKTWLYQGKAWHGVAFALDLIK